MKRIALFSHGGVAPPGRTSDVPSVSGLVRRLARQFDITWYIPAREDAHGADFPCGDARVTFVRAHYGDRAPVVAARMVQAFRRDHRTRPFDVVHGLWALPGGLAAVTAGRLWNLPSIVSILGGEAARLPGIGYGNMCRSATRHATLWTCTQATALVALTRFQLECLRLHGFHRTRDVHVIPFGAEPSFLEEAGRREASMAYNLLHVAHINRVKDQPTLLKAFQRICRETACHLRIVGEDTLGGRLQRMAAEMGIADRVTFAGYVPHDELHAHYRWAHLLMHTSLYEGEGVVFAEASAAGIPICGTRVGLLADLGDVLAATADVRDDAAIAGNALRVLGAPQLLGRLSASARLWAGAHTADWTASRVADLYGHCMEGG